MTSHPECRDSLVNGQANTEASCVCGELGVEEHTSSNLCSYLEQVMRRVLMER